MASGGKLQTIHHLSLVGHSFVCVTVIGLKLARFLLVIQVYSIRACSAGWLTEMTKRVERNKLDEESGRQKVV